MADFHEFAWEHERQRLVALESLYDEITRRHLERIGVGEGWRCLEVGAGRGSIAQWLCERVGPTGHVTATDLHLEFLEALDHANVEVRRHDVATDPLDTCAFDLIHARMVLEHLPGRDDVVGALIAALRPGGWLLLEDLALAAVLHAPAEAQVANTSRARELMPLVNHATHDALGSIGADANYGSRLPGVFLEHGLEEVDAELTARLVRGATPRAEYSRLTMELLADALVEKLPPGTLKEAIDCHGDPHAAWLSAPVMSAWGRRPADPSQPFSNDRTL